MTLEEAIDVLLDTHMVERPSGAETDVPLVAIGASPDGLAMRRGYVYAWQTLWENRLQRRLTLTRAG